MTQEELKSLLYYDPLTGIWTWINSPRDGWNGRIAGTVRQDGYRYIRINGVGYFSARLVWLYMTGNWPKHLIDHINRNRDDDRWNNIREATHSQNCSNRTMQSNNSSGYRGVSWDRIQGRWDVRVNRQHIGWYEYLDEAVEARDAAALSIQGSFAVLNQTGEVL